MAIFLVLICFVGRALWRQICAIDWRSIQVRPLPLLGGAAAFVVVYAGRALMFRTLLHGYGARVPWREAAIVAWLPQLGKYMPGQVASLAGAVALLRRFQVGAPTAMAALLVMDGVGVLTGLISGAPLLIWSPVRGALPLGWAWCALVAVAGVICLVRGDFVRLLNFALRKLKRAPLERLPRPPDYILAMLIGFGQWVFTGAAVLLITRSLTPVPALYFPLFVAIAALAFTAGYLTPFAPGGLGVREAVFQVMLVSIVSHVAAIVVIAVRLVQILVEIVMAAVGLALLGRVRTR